MDMLVLVRIMSLMCISVCIKLCGIMFIYILINISMIVCMSVCINIRIKITGKRNIKCLRKPKK